MIDDSFAVNEYREVRRAHERFVVVAEESMRVTTELIEDARQSGRNGLIRRLVRDRAKYAHSIKDSRMKLTVIACQLGLCGTSPQDVRVRSGEFDSLPEPVRMAYAEYLLSRNSNGTDPIKVN